VKPDAANAKAVFAALAQFGAPLEDMTPSDFADFAWAASRWPSISFQKFLALILMPLGNGASKTSLIPRAG